MKIVLISVLLFFELCSAFSIQKIQLKDSQTREEPGNQTDVYEIEEGDNKIVRLVHPRPEKPVLREITYFHVVETPYEDYHVDDKEGSEGPELDSARRPFTNSHGFQFLADDPDDIDDHESTRVIDDTGDVKEEVLGPEENSPRFGEEVEYKMNEDGDFVRYDHESTRVIGGTGDVKKEVSEPDEENSPRFGEEVEYKMNKDGDFVRVSEKLTTEANEATTVLPAAEEALDTAQSDVATADKKKKARNLLFNQARGKYQAKTREKTIQRPKREISLVDLPPAPTLRPLELGLLPEYIRKLISTPKPETSASSNDAPTHFNEDKFKDELEKKIHDMITSLKPQRDEDDHDDEFDVEDEDIEDRDDKKEETGSKRVPRTYGMNLTMGRGYVWNDLLTEPGTPGLSFDIGEPNEIFDREETTEEPKKPEATEKPTEQTETPAFTESFTSVPHPTESKPIHISNNEHDKENDKRKPEEESSDHRDFEDIEVNKFKPKLLLNEDSLEDKGYNKVNSHVEDKDVNDKIQEKEAASDNSRYEERKQHNLGNKKHKPETPDTFKELMKNEEFWKWLGDWTATYMELLMKHIKHIVQDEVASQMKTLAEKLKKDLQLEEREQNKDKQPINNEEEKNHSGNEANKCDCSDKPSKEENHTEPDIPKDDDNKLIIDGKEIPITHNTNFDIKDGEKEYDTPNAKPHDKHEDKDNNETSDNVLLRHRKHEDKEKDKNPIIETSTNKDDSKSPISITAQNIFGNAAGSDKVTNIFIFYPQDDKVNSIISNEINNAEHTGTNNLYTFGSSGEFDIDKRHPDLTGMKDKSTMTENDSQKNSNDKPNDSLSKNKEESEKDKKEEATHSQTEPSTTTQRKEIDKSENNDDKKEPDNKIPAKENEMKIGQPNEKNKLNKSSSDVNTEKSPIINLLENKEHDEKKGDEKLDTTLNLDNKNKEKPDDKKEINENAEVTTESTDSKVDTTSALLSNSHENEVKLENKIPENKEERKENSETTENAELEKILKKEVEKEINKALGKEIEKEIKKEDESVKEEKGNKDKEVPDKDSEKKKDEIILQS